MKNIIKFRIRLFKLSIFTLSLTLSFLAVNAQSAIFFAAKNDATEFKVFRYRVTPTTDPVLESTLTDASLIYPLGLTLSPAGELFVVNQGNAGGIVTRFSNPSGAFNGTVAAGPEMTFYGAFKGNELFVTKRYSGVLRFIVDPISGDVTPNGQISIAGMIGEFRGIVVTPWGELFVSESAGGVPAIIHRYTFDASGNAQPNGIISDPNMGQTHGMTFSPWGELFATSPSNNSIARFKFDAARNASFNGSINGGGINVPLDVSFAPWGELFVGNCGCNGTFPPGAYQGISRFKFDAAGIAAFNGTVTTIFPISGIAFVPGPYDSIAPISTSTLSQSPNAAGWNNSNVTTSISATDNTGGTGVSKITYSTSGAQTTAPTDVNGPAASITITTEGITTVNYFATDLAGNIESAQTLTIKIDKTPPIILVTEPINGSYLINQSVVTDYSCTDSLSGVMDCTGTTPTGAQLDTGSAGAKSFNVSSTDNAGNSAVPTIINYNVNYGLVVLFDQSKAHKSGSTVPVKVQLVDANGANVSSPSNTVHAVSVLQISSQASTTLDDSGNANPDFDFRYDSGLEGYLFNLKTNGYQTGTYKLNFVVSNSATVYSVNFQVRQ
jgi:hypothetical protein